MRGKFHDKDVQSWYTIRISFEKETNDLNILQVSFEARFLAKGSRQFALWRMMKPVLLPVVGVGGV